MSLRFRLGYYKHVNVVSQQSLLGGSEEDDIAPTFLFTPRTIYSSPTRTFSVRMGNKIPLHLSTVYFELSLTSRTFLFSRIRTDKST